MVRGNSKLKVLNQVQGKDWVLYQGDCVEIVKGMPDSSIDFSIFSPPFSSLYVFSDSERDMSNCSNHKQFIKHFRYLLKELYRIVKPGRIVVIHCMDLTTTIGADGYLSIIDLGGVIIRLMQRIGFYYHTPITIWKNPVVEVTRTKNIQLLYHQFCKDASISRTSLPDRLLVFRKPGENKSPIVHDKSKISPEDWGKLASPIWMDINQSNTLNSQKEDGDEKHISCLQLDVIERAIKLWTNENDIVFSPFSGIGSETYQAVKMNRKGIGIELKESYFNQAVKNMQSAEQAKNQISLFDKAGD